MRIKVNFGLLRIISFHKWSLKRTEAKWKEGNDQESKQLPNTFRPSHQKERRTHLKQRHRNENTTSRKPEGQFLSQNWPNGYPKQTITRTYMETYTDRNSKPQQKHRLGTASKHFTGKSGVCFGGGGGAGGAKGAGGRGYNSIYMATTRVLSSPVVYTRHLFNPREGFLTHQCNISENIEIKRIQIWNKMMTRRQ